MSRILKSVTCSRPNPSHLPDWASRGCVLLADLERRGSLLPLSERVRIRRTGGFSGVDVLLLLVHFFASGLSEGLRPFWRHASPFSRQLAALGERLALPSPASVSRALDRVELSLFRPQIAWLLAEATGADEVLTHPVVTTRDAHGESWHIFHFDPTVTALRQRPLAEGDDLPEPRRRVDEAMAVPGHRGRKRGDVVFRRATLQHAGSGLWLHGTLAPGNGDRREALEGAADVVVATCARIVCPTSHALFIMDGEFANVPAYQALRDRGLPFITRCVRYELLDQPEVRQRLRAATWFEVPTDGGPRRSATDLGIATLPAGAQTRRADGRPYDPFAVRIVVTRYERSSEAEHGRVIDGWQYELFAVDVNAGAWPAPDAVAVFFGRGAQENRFAQEDRELDLDRVLSYHLPGQEFASVVGLMVWNLRLINGFRVAPPPAERGPAPAREDKVDRRGCPLTPTDEPVEPKEPEPSAPEAAHAALREELNQVPWSSWEARNPGWGWDSERAHIQCPTGIGLRLVTVRLSKSSGHRSNLHFRAPTGRCSTCPNRSTCLPGAKVERKSLGVTVDTPLAKKIGQRFRVVHGRPLVMVGRRPPKPVPVSTQTTEAGPGSYAVHPALFLPAEARRRFDAATDDLRVAVTVTLPERRPRPVLVADAPARRQHRRKTWAEHLERYDLPDAAHVHVRYTIGPRATSLRLGGDAGPGAASA